MRTAFPLFFTKKYTLLQLLVFLILPSATYAVPLAKTSVIYVVSQQNLAQVADDLALTLGVPFIVDPAIREKSVSGMFEEKTIHRFLNLFTKKLNISWFFDGRRVYLFHQSNIESAVLVFSETAAFENFTTAINQEDFTGRKASLSFNEKNKEITVKGEENYLRRVFQIYKDFIGYERTSLVPSPSSTTHTKSNAVDSEGIMIFRLKHAWAADKIVILQDQQQVILPGVSTLLNQLLTGTRAPAIQKNNNDNGLSPLKDILSKDEPVEITPQPQSAGFIMADERQNAILIRDSIKHYDYYRHLIEDFDYDAPLIEIEASIIDILKSDLFELGIAWEKRSPSGSTFGFNELGNTLSNANSLGFSSGGGFLSTAVTGNAEGVLASLLALESEGRTHFVSRPSILTTDNTEAIINTREQFYIRIEGFQDSSVYPVSVGTTLRVTPHIVSVVGEARRIKLLVNIQDGSVDTSPENSISSLPRVHENTMTTQAIVSEKGGLLIGGHTRTTTEKIARRVPILGDIPILGFPFHYTRDLQTETVRMYVIRPRLLSRSQNF